MELSPPEVQEAVGPDEMDEGEDVVVVPADVITSRLTHGLLRFPLGASDSARLPRW